MRARRRGTGFLGVPALALLLYLAGFAYAEDALQAPRLEQAGPAGGHSPRAGVPGFMAMSPAHGVPFVEPALENPADRQDDLAPSEATPVPPDASGTAAGESGQISATALPPVNAALKAALEARSGLHSPLALLNRGEREAIAAFYALRDFAPLWFSGGKPNAEAAPAIERLKHAADDGLDVKGFPQAFSPTTDEEIAAADLALSDAVVAYGRQASGSRVDPRMISRLIGIEPEVADPAVILALVATAGEDAGEELRRFNPPQQAYEALREKLLQLPRGRGAAGRDATIPSGPVLRPGMRDPRVPLIRARLSLDDAATVEDSIYDTRMAAAVADFQKANGLPPSGRLTARTVAVLSGGPSSLEAEILANMERWRWMPRDMGETHIEVNIPDYEVVVVEKGDVIERARVVVGKEETPTPVFSDMMRFLIVNPYWNVPQSIIRKEMLPRLAADPDYLHRLGYEVSSRAGHLVVRQPPGERNALGRIKFMFPNDFAVYMHDTPMRSLFAAQKRAFSHGCVRVDDPFRFAETVLGRANGWSAQRVKKMIGGKERYVYLPKPLPVHLEYFTAFVDESGELQLRDDVYGYSRRVKAALGLQG
ncbi:MAG: L,D-transpeptidase family protein [Pseudomonadota bacterium]|nr:L,D-transpeptidase family protein [Pseudomonadota bacterium]